MHTLRRLQNHLTQTVIGLGKLVEPAENHPSEQVVLGHFYSLHAFHYRRNWLNKQLLAVLVALGTHTQTGTGSMR